MRILLSGGGTAGHVLPHIAVVKALQKTVRRPSDLLEILYVGSKTGPEQAIARAQNWEFRSIPVGKFRRYWDWRHLTDPFKIVAGFLKSLTIVRRFKPDVLFSKGGYVSVPVTLAAWIWRVPIVLHDSDARPGLTTRLLGRLARTVCLGYAEAKSYLPRSVQKKAVVTGIPIREEVLKGNRARGLQFAGLKTGKPVILVMGGSLGAQRINEVVADTLPELLKFACVIHLTGRGKNILKKRPGYVAFEYVDRELPDLYACADVVVTRAGANALAELCALGKRMVVVPLGAASHGDQVANARLLESHAEVLFDPVLTPRALLDSTRRLLEKTKNYIKSKERSSAAQEVAKRLLS